MSDAQNVIVVSPKLWSLLVEDRACDAISRMITATLRGESYEFVQHPAPTAAKGEVE